MFLEIEELGSVIYGFQMDDITEGDDDIVLQAINTAIEEVGGYLSGTSLYNVPAIFAAQGRERNALILAYTKTIAKWYITELCNADVIYETAKERYDRAVLYLTKLSKGTVTLESLPILTIDGSSSETDNFGFGSRLKFKHDI